MKYRKAPILEAVIEFRWQGVKDFDALSAASQLAVFEKFEGPKPRNRIDTSVKLGAGAVSQERKQIGFELALQDNSKTVFLEENKLAFIQRAPYDRWESFSEQALEILEPTISELAVDEFSRVGVRFVNRIDAPRSDDGNIDTDDYITVKLDGPRRDKGIVQEFQMRVVKPTEKDWLSYALIVATSGSPLPNHVGIILDIDVFSTKPVLPFNPCFIGRLEEMRNEKNEIFELCITDHSRALFGGTEE